MGVILDQRRRLFLIDFQSCFDGFPLVVAALNQPFAAPITDIALFRWRELHMIGRLTLWAAAPSAQPPHHVFPRLRLDLRSALSWREDMEVALERLLGSMNPEPAFRPV